jgi:DnaJ-domain-containing protein 1
VTDYFALLDEPRQPWLDEEALKAKFFALSTSVHPDRVHALPEIERKALTIAPRN